MATKKLWGGRFTGKTDPLMEKFNESLPFDKRMWAEDIRVCAVLPDGALHSVLDAAMLRLGVQTVRLRQHLSPIS